MIPTAGPSAADIGNAIVGRLGLINNRGAAATAAAQQQAAARRLQIQQQQAAAAQANQQRALQEMQSRVAQQQAAQQAAYNKQLAAYRSQVGAMQGQMQSIIAGRPVPMSAHQAHVNHVNHQNYAAYQDVLPAHGSARPVANSGSFQSFLNSIAKQESGGNYGARNASSGAMGKYQIMPSNLGGAHSGWDYEALGYDITPAQFMANPQLQEAIAQHKLLEYFNRYGAAGAAMAWYGGPGAVKYSQSAKNAGQGGYPSINGYANAVVRRMGG